MYIKYKVFTFATQKELTFDNPALFKKAIKKLDTWLLSNPSVKLVDVAIFDSIKGGLKKKAKARLVVSYTFSNPSPKFEKPED